eukprot:CAMPEP_0198224086 /NCGR_PEP_ID=MMETSP1445-20131203/95333_1 /TAXON_ID=36898 /ORGANISM="Pyramimonas sp., Strain CCMP2087" /LENGTH=146 /DNA_ID=CAMNT_0043903133 /DNA_START=146 /DNA_END=586 /DNA_ORIENTATION=-
MGIEGGRLVGAQLPDLHLPFGESEHDFMVLLMRPGDTGDGARLVELVADALFVAPLRAQLVDEHDVVALADGQLAGVGRKRHAAHHIVLSARRVRGLCRELVFSVTVFIEQVNDAICGDDGHSTRVEGPCDRGYFRDSLCGWKSAF